MEKQKVNLFVSKFHMLNSQENNEEINWSSSASSDYENCTSNNFFCTNRNGNRKRKRKKIVPKNISNLDVTIIDVSKDRKGNKSPILNRRTDKSGCVSPILMSNLPPSNNSVANSPILCLKDRTSPILLSRNNSPNVRKNLFKSDTTSKDDYRIICRNKIIVNKMNINSEKSFHTEKKEKTSLNNSEDDSNDSDSIKSYLDKESSNSNKVAQINLVDKVKSYFDSHFSSENASLNSISDYTTPKENSRTSDEIEMLTCKTQFVPNNNSPSIKQEDLSSVNSPNESLDKPLKKIRYKKDGLAYRLNDLLKKQIANISLWQHEKFLAENSNFIIPKKEHIMFRIQKVHSKYGCYLLETTDIYNDNYLILISNCNVSNKITCDFLFKIYAPYKILDFHKDCKLIVNVNKFECLSME